MRQPPLLHQTISWQVGTQDTRGDRTYAEATTIKGRVNGRLRDVVGANGETVTVTSQFTLLVEPAVGDLLNGREVVAVLTITDYTGTDIGYQAMTR